jgi:hypothetical protein
MRSAVAGAIGVEGVRGHVGGAAVELDDEAVGGPGAVRLDRVAADDEIGIEVRRWEAVLAQEGKECDLEVAPGSAFACVREP